jgi:anti-sigma regulatory factor (Ser/Thr protein kinase)
VRCAREFVRRQAQEWQLSDSLAADVELAASELVTNAVIHAGGIVELMLRQMPDRLRLEVADTGDQGEVRRIAEDDATGGRGLLILDALAREWGVREHPHGKAVWADFAAYGPPQPSPRAGSNIES